MLEFVRAGFKCRLCGRVTLGKEPTLLSLSFQSVKWAQQCHLDLGYVGNICSAECLLTYELHTQPPGLSLPVPRNVAVGASVGGLCYATHKSSAGWLHLHRRRPPQPHKVGGFSLLTKLVETWSGG